MGRFDSSIERAFVIAGILDSTRALSGPEELDIDLTNRCNNNCIGCWCRSPLLKDKTIPKDEGSRILPFELIKNMLDELDEMGGVQRVKLTGGGEPFMHPRILEVVEYIKSKDKRIEIDINTNFTLIDKKTVSRLIEVGVDSITVSVWAGTAETYARLHPNKSKKTFRQIRDILKLMAKLKEKERGRDKPLIRIFNVIFNMNYHEVDRMLDFALKVRAERVQFVPFDPIPGRTDRLLLNKKEKGLLMNKLRRIKQFYNSKSSRYADPQSGASIMIVELDDFMRRLSDLNLSTGAYDDRVVDRIPCYVGWLFARVMANGDVVPCYKGHRMPMGNIHQQGFKEIWFGTEYDQFRHNAKCLSKSRPYFLKIGNKASRKTGCYNCDNFCQNEPMHQVVSSLDTGRGTWYSTLKGPECEEVNTGAKNKK